VMGVGGLDRRVSILVGVMDVSVFHENVVGVRVSGLLALDACC
jgi:hypothetical protein